MTVLLATLRGVAQAKIKPVSVARMRVQRATGREVIYSPESLPWWHLRRRYKLWVHVRLMRREDRQEGWA